MGKDKVEKEKKRAEKKEKRAEKDGVHKKKDKKDKKDKAALADAVDKEITTQVLDGLDQAVATSVTVKGEVDVAVNGVRPVGAVVPFANPLVEDKAAKKVLKSVKKGMWRIVQVLLMAIPSGRDQSNFSFVSHGRSSLHCVVFPTFLLTLLL